MSQLANPAPSGQAGPNEEVVRLLQLLMKFESPSWREQDVGQALECLMIDLGLDPTVQRIGNRANILTLPLGRSPTLLFISHIDTLPRSITGAGEFRIDGDRVEGVGACDAKGSVAAMILAYKELCGHPSYKDRVALALVVGEEVSGDGGEELIEMGISPRYAIVGEPTGLAIPTGQAGYLQLRLLLRGKSRHAFSNHPPSALDCLVEAITILKELIGSESEGFPPQERPYLYIQEIRGGSKDKFWYLRRECEATVNINTHHTWDVNKFTAKAQKALEQGLPLSSDVSLQLKVTDWDSGIKFDGSLNGAVLYALRNNGVKARSTYMRSWTDAATLNWKGTQTLVIGPGSLDVAHSAAEWVSLEEVDLAAKIYVDAAKWLLGDGRQL